MKRSSSNLTPGQTANLLAVSPSTLRLWSIQFANYLSAEAQSDGRKHRSYSPDDIGVLKRASELLKTHSPDETRMLLAVADDTQRGAALATLPTIAGEINTLRSQVAALAGELAEMKQANTEIRTSFAQYAARQVKRAKRQQAEIDDLRADVAELKARRHWWQRLARR